MSGKLVGQAQLDKRLRALGEGRPVLREVQKQSIAEAKALVPRRTGFLGRSIVPGSVTATTAIVEVRTPYAAAVEFGRRAITIKPKNAKMLAWPVAGAARLSGRPRTRGGKPVGPFIRAKEVHQKARAPKPYLIPAIRKVLTDGGWRDVIFNRWNGAA